jgi:hypothetical protein
LRRKPKQDLRRQAKLHLVGSSGNAVGRLPSLAAARLRPRVSQRIVSRVERRTGATSHRKVARDSGRNQEPGSPQGARDGSRLQKSVRRIFLDARASVARRCRGAR